MKPYKIKCCVMEKICIGFLTGEKTAIGTMKLKPYTRCTLKSCEEYCNLDEKDEVLKLTEDDKAPLLKFLLTGEKERKV